MKTEQGEIPALFSCREAWGGAAPAGLARRLRRGRRAVARGALYCFGRRSEGFQRGTEGSEYPVDTTAEGG